MANPIGTSSSAKYNLTGVLPKNTVAKLIESAINKGVAGDVDDTPTSSPNATMVSLSQTFRYRRRLTSA